MNSSRFRIVVALALLALAWLAADWYFSDEQKLRRRLAHIQKLVAKSPAESDIAGLATARKLSDVFADPFSVSAEPEGYSSSDRQALIGGIHSYRSRTSTLVLEITGEQIFLDDAGTGANTFFTARFLTDLGDLRGAEQYDTRIHWVKQSGEWMISDVKITAPR